MDTLEQFRETYITECFELLGDMEEKLMGLEAGGASSEDLNAIFRCAHSIKGGAGAFGLNEVAAFTHILEALLDRMREGKIAASAEVVETLLKSRDVVMQMIMAAQSRTPVAAGFGSEIAALLEAYCGREAAPVTAVKQKESGAASERFTLRFVPKPEMLLHGSEPLLLIRELKRLGDCEVRAEVSKIPPLAEMDPERCYISWEVTLTTDKGEAAVREVFEFVEDECELVIIRHPVTSAASAQNPEPESLEILRANAPHPPQDDKKGNVAATSIRVDIDKVDRLINMVGEIVIVQAMLAMQSRQLPPRDYAEMIQGVEELTQHTRELQEAVMAIRMQPVKSIFSRMPRLVRDLSAQLGKNIRLEMVGENTEVDKTIIEQLSDPLTHMIRNSVDHGVETPETRREAGKEEQGCITLSAMHRGGRIVIEISDNGGGINREKVLAKAKEKGVVAREATLSDSEIDQLIFAPGFSTAEAVTSVSGRGVGMDVVKRNIEGIGGSVFVDNQPGQGAVFSISLPLTLAILDGMIVRVAGEHYIIPITHIIETMRPKAQEVKRIADGSAVLNVRGEFLPVQYLHALFGIPGAVTDASQALVVLVEAGAQQMGLVVDELVGQQQVVIKSLEENADRIEGISGATILGDGKVSLILDITGLARMAHQPQKERLAA